MNIRIPTSYIKKRKKRDKMVGVLITNSGVVRYRVRVTVSRHVMKTVDFNVMSLMAISA